MKDKRYTFELAPGKATRYNAGAYDQATQQPRFTIEWLVPEHAKSQVEISQFLMGSEGNRLWVWDITNKSTWPAFVSVYRDGQLVTTD